QWLKLKGGMPQGTWLGLYIFLILINDLTAPVKLHKYVDDVTLSEMLAKQEPSSMQSVVNDVIKWSATNLMKINERKTKEMLVGTLNRNPPPTLYIDSQPIERVSAFKLLGITISDSLSWEENVGNICSKAGKRLHFLKLLKRSGVSTEDLLYYYSSVVRPVLEYGCVVWQSSITEEQKHRLDSMQRRAERIIGSSEASGKLTPLTDRRNDLARRFFKSLQQPTSCLHNILPDRRDPQIIDRLRHANTLTIPFAKTERYKNSFLINALANYQLL
ncbi:MAG TPA: reverse transcriptase domain-containing protein, partial [Methylococcales bacterium]